MYLKLYQNFKNFKFMIYQKIKVVNFHFLLPKVKLTSLVFIVYSYLDNRK